MLKNIVYDVLIIGASTTGINIAKKITTINNCLSVVIVSTYFTPTIAKELESSVELIEDTSIYTNYNHGLIEVSLKSGNKIYCKNAIIAVGDQYKKLKIKGKDFNEAYYNLKDIKHLTKNNQLVILGNSEEAALTAITVSKKVSYVYLCFEDKKINISRTLLAKLKQCSNIAILANSKIIDFTVNKNKQITSINLASYGKIHCTGVLIITDKSANISGFENKLIKLSKSNKIMIDNSCRTKLIPNIFAVGSCADNFTKEAELNLIDYLASKKNNN